jgi:hypothetical protein
MPLQKMLRLSARWKVFVLYFRLWSVRHHITHSIPQVYRWPAEISRALDIALAWAGCRPGQQGTDDACRLVGLCHDDQFGWVVVSLLPVQEAAARVGATIAVNLSKVVLRHATLTLGRTEP